MWNINNTYFKPGNLDLVLINLEIEFIMYLHLQAKSLYSLLAFLSPWGWHWIISSHHEPPNGQAWLALFREILHHLVYAIIPGTIRSSYFHHLTVDIKPPFFTFYMKILGRNIVDSNKGHTLLGGPKWRICSHLRPLQVMKLHFTLCSQQSVCVLPQEKPYNIIIHIK